MKRVDSINRGFLLRENGLVIGSSNEVLVADFSETLQKLDTTRFYELMPNIRTGERIFRVKANVKDIDPLGCKSKGIPFVDISKMGDKEIEDYLKVQEFDFPLWFKNEPFYSLRDASKYNIPFIVQVAGCNFHDGSKIGGCSFCFVDNILNDGLAEKGKTYLNVEDAVDSFVDARKKFIEHYSKECNFDTDMRVFRVSGGEPTLALDWVLKVWKEINSRKLENVVGQLDSNLSTGKIIDEFVKKGIYHKNILEQLAEHPIRILAAIKGTDQENLQSNVQATTTIEEQKYSIGKFLKAGFDVYFQMYNPNPKTLAGFLDKMDKSFPNSPLRTHIGPLKRYGPTKVRLEAQAEEKGISSEDYIAETEAKWKENYDRSCEVIDGFLRGRYGVGYKEIPRCNVKVKIVD